MYIKNLMWICNLFQLFFKSTKCPNATFQFELKAIGYWDVDKNRMFYAAGPSEAVGGEQEISVWD